MQPNPVLKKLGFTDNDRVVIIHTDDIGMCQASLSAFVDLWEFGLISSGATMVPCPWFPQIASYCRQHPEVDMGVHLTLTSEWDNYRWGPVSTRDPASGLLDGEGYFFRSSEEVQECGNAGAVQVEMQAQFNRARSAGIAPTHIDTHMGAVAHPKFISAYVQLALEQRLPVMVPRLDEAEFRQSGLDPEAAAIAAQFVQQLEAMEIPLLDGLAAMPLDQPDERIDQVKKALAGLPAGVTHFIIHPSSDTPELRAITSDWPSRVADYRAFTSEELRRYIQDCGVQVIGYRQLKELMVGL